MAQYFDVAAAKADGMSDDEINRIMTQMKLKPKPAAPAPTATPSATPSQGMSVDEAVGTPAPVKEPGILSKIGKGVKDVAAAIIKAPARLGDALGTSAAIGKTQQSQDELLKVAQDNTKKAVEMQKAGKTEEAKRFYKLAQDSLDLINKQANETIATAEKGQEDLIKGGVGTAAMFIPGGQSTMIGKVAASTTAGAAAGYGASEDGEELESALGGAAIGAALPIVGGGLKWLFSRGGKEAAEATAKTNVLKRAGEYLREDATKIRVKPSVWGAKKEKAILETLNTLGIEGTPQQKYELLAPKMEQLGKQVGDELTAKPSNIKFIDVITKFKDNLKSAIRTSDLSSTTAQKEIKGYLTDLYEVAGHDPKGQISNVDFFKLKQLVNEDYQGVAKKILSNTPLTDREKVIAVARQVFDDVVSAANPEVKELTLMQSHLYDAASSLSKARDAVPTTRIMGTTVPTPILKGGEDKLGRVLSSAGDKVEAVKSGGMSVVDAVGRNLPGTPTTVAAGVGMLGGEQNTPDAQNQTQGVPGSENGAGQENNGQQETDHGSTIPQGEKTITGYTVEELGSALTQARLAGDNAAVKDLTAMYNMEVSYQDRQTKSKKSEKKTEAQQAREDTSMLATKAIEQLKSIKAPVKTGLIAAPLEEIKAIGGKGDKATLEFNNTISQIKATLAKARAGTSFTPNEEKLLNKYTPKIGDSRQQLEIKLAGLEDFFNRYTNVVPDSSVNIDIGGMSVDQATGGQ